MFPDRLCFQVVDEGSFFQYDDFNALVKSTGQEEATRGLRSFDEETDALLTWLHHRIHILSIRGGVHVEDGGGLSEMVCGVDAGVP